MDEHVINSSDAVLREVKQDSPIAILRIGSAASDPEQSLRAPAGATLETASSVSEGLLRLKQSWFDVLVADFPIGGWRPPELIEEVRRISDSVPIIVRDREGRLDDAVRSVKLGAYQYLGDYDAVTTGDVIDAAIEEQRSRQLLQLSRSVETGWKRFLVGESRAVQDIERMIRLVASRRCTVLITGETGTGKEMVARAVHLASNRSARQMVALNCSAIPENLLEAELFGHTKGAFTGAAGPRLGRFEQANGGTLFLDEIGDMPFELQAKLLRALQEREIQRLGSSESIKIDVRVIAASNVNLLQKIKEGRFREDLYYRLNVVPIKLPPLRERSTDIPLLVYHFIEKICRAEDIPMKRVGRDTLDRLRAYSWPGNIRELENAVEMAVVLSGERTQLYPTDFSLASTVASDRLARELPAAASLPDDGMDFERVVTDFERNILNQALMKARGNKSVAADMLRMPRTTLVSKLRALSALEAS